MDEHSLLALQMFLAPMDWQTRLMFLVVMAEVGSVIAHGEVRVIINDHQPTRIEYQDARRFTKNEIDQLKALAVR
ncbi:MAG: hypothetical protein MOGMAGMI_02505 [Candidatus Omnitrophica bacterium]|nr:hypothetical protein [Candidatus Omnitrophota bacterium]